MPFHVFIDRGPVESSEMRTKNFMRAVVQILHGRVSGARYKMDDGHWCYVFFMNQSISDAYDKMEAMLPNEPHFITPFDERRA